MRNAAGSQQRTHVAGAKHIANHAATLVHVKSGPLGSHDAGRILPAVLQYQQTVIKQLVDLILRNNTQYAAHSVNYP
jgi:hypothetical protein